jgi:hypothetical protein
MFQATVQSVRFDTRAPQALNTASKVSFALPVINGGSVVAENMIITQVTLGSARLIEPVLPLPIGDLGVSNATTVNAVFSAAGLTPGVRYPITVRGTYRVGSTTYGFTLNRFLVIPAPVAAPVAFLDAHVTVAVDQPAGTWTYTVFNDQPAGSQSFINVISIDMAAPFTVVGTPAGWTVDTDNFSYVLWYVADQQSPYPDHIAPGASRSGFRIQSARGSSEGRGYMITAWNHQTDTSDLAAPGTTLTPSRS